jgi:hypothetical protein
VERNDQGQASGLKISERTERSAWAEHAHGAYLLRTNCPEKDSAQLWRWYMQLSACLKMPKPMVEAGLP